MKVLIVDMTHGGLIIATEFLKLNKYHVFAWDIYGTLNQEQKEQLQKKGIKLVDGEFLNEHNDLKVVAPIHCKLDYPTSMSHHEAVAFLMKNNIEVPIIEVTGVKGKTSVIYMLREIFKDFKPLILSSLGVEVLENGEWRQLKEDISITPASIITAWELGQKHHPGIFIVETSLGGTGLARVGILTNIAEDYTIASGSSTASQAKDQIFKNRLIACDFESYHKYYQKHKDITNTFSISGEGNVKASNIIYGFNNTVLKVEVNGLKTLSGETREEEFEIQTFAPAPHHVENVLSAICASLTCGISRETIVEGLRNFHGLKGRTSLKSTGKTRIIEEINPGINSTTVKKALKMIENLPESAVIFGGKYGVTCEEIDEKSVAIILDELNEDIKLILTDELGAELRKRIKRTFNYIEDLNQAIHQAQNHHTNILLIYRSNYPDLSHR
jgi:coenzyme F430 synthetase